MSEQDSRPNSPDVPAEVPAAEVPAPEGRFEPGPGRARWARPAGPDQASDKAGTPERWIEQPAAPVEPAAAPGSGRGVGSRFVAALVLACFGSSLLAAAGTFAALNASGTLNAPAATPGPSGRQVTVESASSQVVAAIAKVSPATVQIVANDGAGSTSVGAGFFYDVRGWILTNKHVVRNAKTITVHLADDRRVSATIYGTDTLTDLAILKASNITDIFAVALGDSSALAVGQISIALGSPLGLAYPNSASQGIVSALGRDISVQGDTPATAGTTTNLHGLIQTDAAINPGNSGGPLIDAAGKVIGITTASVTTTTGSLGFAIPINTAKPIMQQALAGEKLSRPFIGVTYTLVDKGLAATNSLPIDHGAWVHKDDSSGNPVEAVTAGSPAATAGLKTGDIITAVEGQAIDRLHLLEDLLVQYSPGRTITLQVYRGGSYLAIQVTLGTRPDNLT
jgi:S1-C subfamily serine protease